MPDGRDATDHSESRRSLDPSFAADPGRDDRLLFTLSLGVVIAAAVVVGLYLILR